MDASRSDTSDTAAAVRRTTAPKDDALTICAISAVASMLSTMLHEGLGHAAVAIVTLHASGILTTVAWSSNSDSRLVAAGGTLVNLAAGFIFLLLLRYAAKASPATRFFLLILTAFNLFSGTGYFFYSGVTNFGDWEQVIRGLHPYWVWRTILIVVGITAYYGAVFVVGTSLVRSLGVALTDHTRIRRLMWLPYFTALILEGGAALLNPFGVKFVFVSALAATAGGQVALLWLQYYIPKSTVPGPDSSVIRRSYPWIIVAAVLAAAFITILGTGIHLPR